MLFVLVAALVQAAAPAAAPLPAKTAGTNSLTCPTDSNYRYYPARAAATNVTGRAVVNCNVSASGKLEQCIVVKEEPPSEGFGQAALLMAECLMKPKPGRPVDQTGRVDIPIRFDLPK
jgi:TonB family protein